MSTEQDQVRAIAERIARRVSQPREVDGDVARGPESERNVGDELAAMRASLEELKQRLVQIESHVTNNSDDASQRERDGRELGREENSPREFSSAANGVRSPWLSGIYVPATHPSQERF